MNSMPGYTLNDIDDTDVETLMGHIAYMTHLAGIRNLEQSGATVERDDVMLINGQWYRKTFADKMATYGGR